jgi:hypothetical protein
MGNPLGRYGSDSGDNDDLVKVLLIDAPLLGLTYGAAGERSDQRDSLGEQDRATFTYHVSRDQGPKALEMRALLEEAEEYCRTHLLTLEQPEAETRFSRWYVEQFALQCAGAAPEPWPGPWD